MLAGIFLAAGLINALATVFGAPKNRLNAFKVVAYSMTPVFVVGILGVIPSLSGFILLGALYGAYLLYLGLRNAMDCPPQKAIGYTVAALIVMGIIYGLVGVATEQSLAATTAIDHRVPASSPQGMTAGDRGCSRTSRRS